MSLDQLTAKLDAFGISDFKPYPGTNPCANPFDVFRGHIATELSRLTGADPEICFSALEWSTNPERPDLLVPLRRLRLDKKLDVNQKAVEWADQFNKANFIERVSPDKAFLQFYFNPTLLTDLVIKDILNRREKYGFNNTGEGKTILIEFSSPNIAKPFHAGHLRSTIIGGFLSNLHEALGWKVIRMNYLGDWGKQFGILAVGYKRYGDEELLKTNPIQHLFDVYVRVNNDIKEEEEKLEADAKAAGKEAADEKAPTDIEAQKYFSLMEEGNDEALSIWRRFRELSIEKYIETYNRLNISYDVYSGESQVPEEESAQAEKIIDEKGIAITEPNGAKLIDLTKFKMGKARIRRADGTTLYLTRDIGTALARYNKYHFDKCIYVVASQQNLYFQQLFKILQMMEVPFADKVEHINFGLVKGMSTRKGTVVFLDNILEEARDAMHEVMKKNEEKYAQVQDPDKVADLVGISAVMIQDMAAKRVNDYEFNWSRMLSFEGDTGPYLQYAHSRLNSIARNANISAEELAKADLSLLTENEAIKLVRILAKYPDVILQAAKNSEPTTIVTYLFKLTHEFSSCYDKLWVAGQEPEIAKARLALYTSVRQVLNNGMRLLGLTPVERM
ncbi:hypothetical protein CANCADRAFT_33122 [Tortispora caseinolytica NRRL Y-17796]|uniref:arginine--tRNA ligase n=1 Tax=Tortispora caseinolytica NRRL Y-17796 TaxID=767744 RepID=A0A1E4TIA1_9ASCO|nr:hypothetical protein CANCADRAFT_33122 [Tortispora caseinolytica NRRL Y-17796]